MVKFVFIVFGLLVLQGLLSFFQVKDYKKNSRELIEKGNLFMGHVRGYFKAGSIVIMAIDDDFNIIEGRSMTGITVFNKFKVVKELEGKNLKNYNEWLDEIKNKRMKKAILNGIEAMNKQLNNDSKEADESKKIEE